MSTIPSTERLTGWLCGRDYVIKRLLGVVQRVEGSRVVLHDTGGGGKTAVVLEVVDRLALEQPCTRIWWIDASTENSLNAGLREVGYDADSHQRFVEIASLDWIGFCTQHAEECV